MTITRRPNTHAEKAPTTGQQRLTIRVRKTTSHLASGTYTTTTSCCCCCCCYDDCQPTQEKNGTSPHLSVLTTPHSTPTTPHFIAQYATYIGREANTSNPPPRFPATPTHKTPDQAFIRVLALALFLSPQHLVKKRVISLPLVPFTFLYFFRYSYFCP